MTKAEKIRTFGEVFTPPHIVNDMCDMLEAQNDGARVFLPETTFLEPACGDGAFVVEILRRKFRNCRKRQDYTTALESVYAMEIQADNVEACIENVKALCGEFFKPTKAELEIIENHVIQADSLKVMQMINDMNARSEA